MTPDGTRVSLLYFSDQPHVQFDLNSYDDIEDILYYTDNMPYVGGRTNTAGALKMMRQNMFKSAKGDRPTVPNYAVILTDGAPNVDENKTVD